MVDYLGDSFIFLIENISSWMHAIFEATNGIPIYLGGVAIFITVRLLLRQYFGRPMGGGSDYAAASDRKR